jgi:hypothetical protein
MLLARIIAFAAISGCLLGCGEEGAYVGIPKSCEDSYETGIADGRRTACRDIERKVGYELYSRLQSERVC